MRRFIVPVIVAIALAMPVVLASFARSAPATAAPSSNAVPGQYIVTLKDGEQPAPVSSRMTAQDSIEVEHVYSHALNGFSAKIPDGKLDEIRNDPAVLSVIEDRVITIAAETSPSGIRRSEADRNAISLIGSDTNPINVDVAVLDTGIDGNHPDLNVVGGISCVPGESSWEDQHGHGTHVAGTIGALDNDTGVVGVAPGARLWAVRVLNASGEGEFSDLMCGVDWITANAATIEVANMSLGGEGQVTGCSNGGLHQAICESVAAGITYVAASGNSGIDAGATIPAAYPEVITVSAIADTDGRPGGDGPSSIFYGADDTLATFSNYGSVVDIAAPGVNIQSTWLNGSYNLSSGTSMASPHVAGAAAIYAHQNPGASPAAVRAHVLSEAWPQSSPEGFTGDRDAFPEPLLNAGAIGGLEPLPPPPLPEPGCSLSAESGVVGSTTTLSCAGFQASEWVWIYWDAAGTGARGLFIASGTGEGSANITVPPSTFGEHQVIAVGSTSGIQGSAPFTVEPFAEVRTPAVTVGGSLQLILQGFGADEPVEVRWFEDEETYTVIKVVTTTSTGRASVYTSAPERPGGVYTIMAVGTNSGASDSGEVTLEPSLKISPFVGNVGANVTATMYGFQIGEPITVFWSGEAVATTTANSSGTGIVQFVVPEGPGGSLLVEAIGASGSVASDDYSVNPGMELSSTRDVVGSAIELALTGFAAGEAVEVNWYDTMTNFSTLMTINASAAGSASTTITIPEGTYGFHRVEAVGLESGTDARKNFNVTSNITLSETSGAHGASVTATMTGYNSLESINVKWYEGLYSGDVIGTATSSELGTATFTFQIPDETSFGEHKVESATISNQRRASTTFTVEGEDGPVEATCLVTPDSGTVGSRIDVECYGFEPGEYVRIYWDSTSTWQRTVFKASNGSGSGSFTIPDATSGEHTVIGVGSTSGLQATTTMTVVASFELNKTSGQVGDYVYANARGYQAGETVRFIWHDGATQITVKSVTASSTGRAASSFPVPEVAGGAYLVEAIGQTSDQAASNEFTVVFGIDLSPTVGKVGTSLVITGNGFEAGATVTVAWDGDLLGSFTASQSGAGSLSITVPEASEGTHTITVEDEDGNTASAGYRITPDMEVSSNREPVGAEVTVELTGFAAGEAIRIEWWDTTSSYTPLDTVTASQDGSATYVLTIPDAAYNFHRLQASGLQSQKTAYVNFYMVTAISLSVEEGQTGTSVTVTLTSFKANETISLHWYTSAYASYEIATGTTDSFGTATITFEVPDGATPGDHEVEGRSSSGFPRADTIFSVTASP